MGEKDLTEKILCDVAERLENRGRMEGLRERRLQKPSDSICLYKKSDVMEKSLTSDFLQTRQNPTIGV